MMWCGTFLLAACLLVLGPVWATGWVTAGVGRLRRETGGFRPLARLWRDDGDADAGVGDGLGEAPSQADPSLPNVPRGVASGLVLSAVLWLLIGVCVLLYLVYR